MITTKRFTFILITVLGLLEETKEDLNPESLELIQRYLCSMAVAKEEIFDTPESLEFAIKCKPIFDKYMEK